MYSTKDVRARRRVYYAYTPSPMKMLNGPSVASLDNVDTPVAWQFLHSASPRRSFECAGNIW
jgi:hypothetical protein